MHSTANIRWFADIRLADRGSVGGKGGSLGELTRANIAVPPGFVITTSGFERFFAQMERENSIRSRVQGLPHHHLEEIRCFSEQLRARFETSPLPEEVCADVV